MQDDNDKISRVKGNDDGELRRIGDYDGFRRRGEAKVVAYISGCDLDEDDI